MIRVACLGDICLEHKDLVERSWTEPGDVHHTVEEFVRGVDISIATLENPLVGDEQTRNKDKLALRASPDTILLLKALKVGAVTLANNHVMDYGAEGGLATIDLLEEGGIQWFGAGYAGREGNPVILERDGISLACLGYAHPPCEEWYSAPDRFGSARYSRADLERLLPDLKWKVDYVFVFMHWGLEDIDYPVPENVRVGREMIELGADVVVGSHPHVYQGYELYDGKYILYSLGNFIFGDIIEAKTVRNMRFTRRQSLRNRIGLVPVFSLDKDSVRLDAVNLFYLRKDYTIVRLTGLAVWLNGLRLGRLCTQLRRNSDEYERWWYRNIRLFTLLKLVERTALKGLDFRPGRRHLGMLKQLLFQDVDALG
jgi:hypothetical protein